MAVRHGYGKLAGTDALVFAYDTGDTVNSYKGEPTVNYISFRNAVAQDNYTSYVATTSGTWQEKHPDAIRAYNVDGTEITHGPNTGVSDWTNTYHCIHALDPELNRPVAVMRCFDSNWKAHNFNTNMAAWDTYGMSAGDQYTISWLQWTTDLNKSADTGLYTRNSSNSRSFWDGRSGTSATAKNTKVRTWQRVYKTFTVSANRDLTDSYALIYQYGHLVGPNTNGVILKVADVQLELKGHPTPFTGNSAGTSGITTRSATQGLSDLTGNTTVDLSNVSFDSDAQIDFDNTDDFIDLPNDLGYSTDKLSVFALFKSAGQPAGNYHIISGGQELEISVPWPGGALRTGVYTNSRYVSNHGSGLNDGNWHYIGFTYDGSTKTSYIDGQAVGTQNVSGTLVTSFSNRRLGRFGSNSSYYVNGKIGLYQVHNKVLTAQEVQTNYRHYRKRFNLG